MMKIIKTPFLLVCFFLIAAVQWSSAQIEVEGYTYQTGNRGFLSQVSLEIYNSKTQALVGQAVSDIDGKFSMMVPSAAAYTLYANKGQFHEVAMDINLSDNAAGDKAFYKIEMQRAPGYIFEITMAEKKEDPDQKVDAIKGALIEVYNNTRKKSELVLKDHPLQEFKVDLLKGNHYTIMIRKEGYLAKRMEAFVDVKGCILCFEGLGDVQPGVSDNLTERNQNGTLLANVSLEKLYTGKKITLNNIYYDYGKSSLRKDALQEIDNAVTFLNDNPNITVELSAHTDSRGKADKNQALSDKRARNAAEYMVNDGEIEPHRIAARGYGESKLLNKCKDGANCTDREHAINRRTEFKILTVGRIEEFRPLERIKQDENMDEIVAGLQGTVRVTDKSQLDAIDAGEIDMDEVADKNSEKQLDGSAAIKTEMKEKALEEAMEKEVVVEKKAMVPSSEDIGNGATEAATKVATKEVVQVATKETMKDRAETMTVVNTKDDVPSLEEFRKVESPLGSYSGFKFVVHYAKESISSGSELYSSYEDLIEYKKPDGGYYYLTGDYADKKYAIAGLSTIKEKNPDAYVVELVAGFIKE